MKRFIRRNALFCCMPILLAGGATAGDIKVEGNLTVTTNTVVDGSIGIRIGTNGTSYALDVNGPQHVGTYSADGTPKLIEFGDPGYVSIGENRADDRLEFTGGIFTFNTYTNFGTGNVGIGVGTNTPAFKLDVHGDIAVSGSPVIDAGGNWVGNPVSGGVTLVDGNAAVLGKVISSGRFSTTVLTSAGYQVDIPFDGVFLPAQIYYTGPCGDPGTFGYLNDGGGGTRGETASISGKWLVYSGSLGSLMEPATVANGVSVNEVITAQSLDNPDCGPSSGSRSGWKMKTISNAAAGLPETIALPITLQ